MNTNIQKYNKLSKREERMCKAKREGKLKVLAVKLGIGRYMWAANMGRVVQGSAFVNTSQARALGAFVHRARRRGTNAWGAMQAGPAGGVLMPLPNSCSHFSFTLCS